MSYPGLSKERGKLIVRLQSAKTRRREAKVWVEGVRVVEEALDSGVRPQFVLVSSRLDSTSRGVELRHRVEVDVLDIVSVSDAELGELSNTEQHQGIAIVCREPNHDLPGLYGPNGPAHILVLDGVQDPGNAGTLIRTARAFGLSGVVALTGTVDLWSPKTVRSSAGAIFHLPTCRVEAEEFLGWVRRGAGLLLADAAGRDVSEIGTSGPWALVLGGEGRGVASYLRSEGGELVSVRMPGGGESLNVGIASGILLYALTRSTP